jgi:HK97 family phage prohead protease
MYKHFQTKIEDVDDKGKVLVAANALGNVDSDQDISMEGSFQKTLKENFNRLRWFLNHDKTLLLGVPIEGTENYPHLKMLGQLNMKKQLSRDVYEDYKLYAEYGKSLEHSIGVDAVKKEQKGDVRRVYEWKLWEYSTLTSWGANEETPMLDIKADGSNTIELINWFELKMKKGNFTDEKFMLIENHIQKLRSLTTEPARSTPVIEPLDYTSIIKQAFSSLKN